MRKTYPTDLSDEVWARLKTHLPASKLPGRLRTHSLRDVFDAIFYVLRSGCPWRMLPGDLPPWSTVYYRFRKFRMSGLWHRIFTILRAAERKRVGKNPDASAAIVDSQSVKTTEEGAGSKGYDAHKNVKGRKRHLLVDTLGLPLSVYVTSADVQDRAGARLLLAGLGPLVPCLKKIWADGAYGGEKLAKWCEEQGGWELEIVGRDREAKGFQALRSALRGADIRVVAQGSASCQELRAQGPDQRDFHRGGADPANAQAASESRVKDQSAGIMMP